MFQNCKISVDCVVCFYLQRTKYTEVTLPENLPIHLPSNNLVSYAEIQH